MFNKVHIVKKLNAADDSNVSYIAGLIERVTRGQTGRYVQVVDNDCIDAETLVIAVGGDGTMLEALRLAHNEGATATGVNLGKVGFLTDFAHDDEQLINTLYSITHNNTNPIEHRIALQCHRSDKATLDTAPYVRKAFNEFVISNKHSDHLIKYRLFIGDRCAGVHRANALIVGTPTGSTAYTLSAGGSLLLPSMEAMQIIPVAPVSMTSRPIIVPSHEEVRVSFETQGEWMIKCDGTTLGTFDNDSYVDTQVVITASDTKVKILHSMYWSYFDMLTQKLGWKSS